MKKLLILVFVAIMPVLLFGQAKPEQVSVGASPNDRTGDPIRTAFLKYNRTVVAAWDSIGNLRITIGVIVDSIYNYDIRMQTLLDSIMSYDARLNSIPTSNNFTDTLYIDYEGNGEVDRPLGLSKTGGVKEISPPISVQLECTRDTISLSPNVSGYRLAIPGWMTGYDLVQVEAYPGNSTGTMTPSINIYRNRGGTEVAMTSAGANFTTVATINTSNDDVAQGDRLEARWTLTGTKPAPDGMMVNLIFKKP